jgi:hypothetical protein
VKIRPTTADENAKIVSEEEDLLKRDHNLPAIKQQESESRAGMNKSRLMTQGRQELRVSLSQVCGNEQLWQLFRRRRPEEIREDGSAIRED